MKRFVLAVAFVCVASFVSGQDFRKTTWGMTKSQVKASEDLEIMEQDEDVIMYETTLAHNDVYVIYVFTNGKLTRSKYVLNEVHLNSQDFVADFENFERLLTKKYGDPYEHKKNWLDKDTYGRKKENWGRLIKQGDLTIYSSYKTDETDLTVIIYGEDYFTIVAIEYTSTDPELNKLEEENILEDL